MSDRGGHKGYHKGIYNVCATEVQAKFKLPKTLPWLTTMSAKEAIDAAVETAIDAGLASDPVALAKRRKSLDLTTKRRVALAARLAAFAKARAGKTWFRTAFELRDAVATSEKTVTSEFGNFFEAVVKPSLSVKTLVEIAERLEVAR